MDWFEKLTGFRETTYLQTRARLAVTDGKLISLVTGASYGIGNLELVSLQTLRDQTSTATHKPGRLKTSSVVANVKHLHSSAENAGALFQVASQFNLLEMSSPGITPEDGVTRYKDDHTQGPACAVATGAATIYRNYFAPVGGSQGQTAARQLDGLADLGDALSLATQRPVSELWTMRNGYALATKPGLDAIAQHLETLSTDQIDALRGKLRIGLHHNVEVTEAAGQDRPYVSQAFCSALPVSYTSIPAAHWQPFAVLVLEAAYEATLRAAALSAQRGASNVVFLTLLGGGAFGNPISWIDTAIRRALKLMISHDLDVRLVSYSSPPKEIVAIAKDFV